MSSFDYLVQVRSSPISRTNNLLLTALLRTLEVLSNNVPFVQLRYELTQVPSELAQPPLQMSAFKTSRLWTRIS
jgi:hypothetical protein